MAKKSKRPYSSWVRVLVPPVVAVAIAVGIFNYGLYQQLNSLQFAYVLGGWAALAVALWVFLNRHLKPSWLWAGGVVGLLVIACILVIFGLLMSVPGGWL